MALDQPFSQPGIDRRGFLRLGTLGAVSGAALVSEFWLAAPAAAAEPPALEPEAALQKLMEGNQRFTDQTLQHPDQTPRRLQAVAQAQHPFATLLCCADSRVPAEIIFDQGIGDIFDVRVAGNIVTPEVLGSLEYAAALLGTPLLMVLGHERCGAVTAAVQGGTLPGDIGTFVQAILPAVEAVKGQPGDVIDQAVTANVKHQMAQLLRSHLLTERLQSGQLMLVGGRYDLDTGRVTLIS